MGNKQDKNSQQPRALTTITNNSSASFNEGESVPLDRDLVVKVLLAVRVHDDNVFVRRGRIREILRISDFKVNEIVLGCSSDEERLNKLVEFWLVWCPFASWRWLIWYLALYDCQDVVDTIVQYAEPLTDSSLTVDNVLSIVNTCNITTYALNDCLGVSAGSMDGIRKRISRLSVNDDQYKEKIIFWWLSTSPFASWECLAESLAYWKPAARRYYFELHSSEACKRAYGQVVKYYKHKKEASLSPDNLTLAFEKTPYHYHRPLKGRYTTNLIKVSSSLDQEDLVDYYQSRHPAPTWRDVAHFMYYTHEYEVLEYILKNFLNVNVELNVVPTEVTSNDQEELVERGIILNDSTSDLSVDNVVKVLCDHVKVPLDHDPKNWPRSRYIGVDILHICSTSVDAILSTCTHDESEQFEKLVTFWLKKCPQASWRWLIWRLQEKHHTRTAQGILSSAEPLTDSTLTVANLMIFFKDVRADAIQSCLRIPQNYKTESLQLQADDDEVKEMMLKWWVECSPFASWDMITAKGFFPGSSFAFEHRVGTARDDLPLIAYTRPASLSVQNFLEIFKDIPDETNLYQSFLGLFLVSNKQHHVGRIQQQYPDVPLKEAILRAFLDAHFNDISWQLIAYKIYNYANCFETLTSSWNTTAHDLYQLISNIQKYHKGTSLQDLCVSVISRYTRTLEDVRFLPLPSKVKTLVELAMIV